MKNDWINRVMGRVHEDVTEPLDAPPGAVSAEPERLSRAKYDEETGQIPADQSGDSESVVNDLLQAWQEGQRNEVAAQILLTPVSYADFARFVYAIGQEDAVQLGLMLDDMAESEGLATDAAHDNLLAKVQGRNLAAGPSEEPGPTGEEPLVPEQGGEALPEPPPVEPEQDPHEVGSQLKHP